MIGLRELTRFRDTISTGRHAFVIQPQYNWSAPGDADVTSAKGVGIVFPTLQGVIDCVTTT